MPSKTLGTITTWVRSQNSLLMVSSELRIQSFATPTIICAVFLQFDFSEGQKDDILYCIWIH